MLLLLQTKPSVERHVSTAGSSTSQQPAYASMSFPCLPGLRNRQFQFVGSTNPDTGVPSPEASTRRTYNQATGSVKPVSARVVSASNANSENPSLAYNPVTYSGKYIQTAVGLLFKFDHFTSMVSME